MAIPANNSQDISWVLEQIEHIAQFGQTKSGVTRLAFTDADLQARKYLIELMQSLGLTVTTDAIGNIIGRYEPEGISSEAATIVMTGSHLDTVPSGGKYDGVLGIVCGLAAVSRLKTRNDLKHPLEVVAFAAEESSRFSFATIGSKVMAGLTSPIALKRIKDHEDISLGSELEKIGLNIDDTKNAVRPANSIKGFVELHIEQGKILEHKSVNIGIVDKVSAPTRLKITVTGMAGHSGVISIEERQDALVGASLIVLAIRNIANEYEYKGAIATVTILKTYPAVINVIPGKVEMWVDIRGTEHESIVEMLQEIKDAVSSIADDNDTAVAIEVLSSEKPVYLSQKLNQIIETVCSDLKLSSLRLDSRAGHDAMNIAHAAPAGLIFVPCKDGVSHNENEYVNPKDITAGLDVLTETLYQLAI